MKKRIPILLIALAAIGAAIYWYRGTGKTSDNRLVNLAWSPAGGLALLRKRLGR